MVTEKILLAVMMFYIALVTASVLKLQDITLKGFFIAIFMPFFLVFFLAKFSRFVWDTDLKKLSMSERIGGFLKLLMFEVKCLPQIHTKLVSTFKCSDEGKDYSTLAFKISSKKLPLQELRNELNPMIQAIN